MTLKLIVSTLGDLPMVPGVQCLPDATWTRRHLGAAGGPEREGPSGLVGAWGGVTRGSGSSPEEAAVSPPRAWLWDAPGRCLLQDQVYNPADSEGSGKAADGRS